MKVNPVGCDNPFARFHSKGSVHRYAHSSVQEFHFSTSTTHFIYNVYSFRLDCSVNCIWRPLLFSYWSSNAVHIYSYTPQIFLDFPRYSYTSTCLEKSVLCISSHFVFSASRLWSFNYWWNSFSSFKHSSIAYIQNHSTQFQLYTKSMIKLQKDNSDNN